MYAPPAGYHHPMPQPQGSNGFGIAALVLGIVGVLFGLIPLTFFFAWILGALALIFGLVGRSRGKRGLAPRGTSTAGVVLGSVALGLGVIGVVIIGSTVKKIDDRIGKADSNDSRIVQDSCSVDQFGLARATGTITNVSGHTHAFSIHVSFRDASGTQLGTGFDFKDLRDGEKAVYSTTDAVPRGTESVRCEVSAT